MSEVFENFEAMKKHIRLHYGIQGPITVSDNWAYYDEGFGYRKMSLRIYFTNRMTLGQREYLDKDTKKWTKI